MPYTKDTLPDAVKALPEHAAEIWMSAYNSAFEQYDGDEEKSAATAWAAVKNKYEKGDDGRWHEKKEEIKAQAAMRIVGAVEEADGFKWRVQLIEAGLDRQGRIEYPRDVIVAASPFYEGARVFALTEAQHQGRPHPFGKSVRDMVGWIENVSENDNGLEGDWIILKTASWLRDMIMDAWDKGKKDLIGLSHDVSGKTARAGKYRKVTEINGVEIDVVYNPIGGGRLLRMTAAKKEEDTMKEKLLKLLAAKRPDILEKIDQEKITDEDLEKLVAGALAEPPGQNGSGDDDPGSKDPGETRKILEEAKITACRMILRDELKDSGLSELSQAKVKKQFEGKIFEEDDLKASIKDEKEYIDKLTCAGTVDGAGQIRVVREEPEKIQAAMDRLFEVEVSDDFTDIDPFDSIRAAYVEITGDTEVRGFIDNPAQLERLRGAFTSTTFSYVLGNTLYRRMVQDYKEVPDYGASRLISTKRRAKDFRTIESVRIEYFGDLPDVTPETNDYPDLGTLSDEEVSYAINQKGGIITITRRMIINDDMGAVQKIVKRLPRAARRTLAKRSWNKFINNDTYKGDSKAVFHADHNNLGASAYAVATLVSGIKALMDQTEPGSNEKLMLTAKTLSIPTALWDTAEKINRTQGDPGTSNFGNPVYQYFGADGGGIFVNPFQTDADDWMLFADPNEVEIIEIAFLNGQEEPEMFVAENPAVGQFFVADKIQYKIRHEYECEIVDYRGAYKAVV
ncbi:MAG: ChaB family protein [Thermodesulfobacteriota bacterium]|nr:ChaB family protein [Thermodesulfobacteriota bacterium]